MRAFDRPGLAVITMTLVTGAAIVVGSLAAFRAGGFFDRLSSVISLLGASIPDFWVAIVAIVVFSVNLAWLPTSGTGSLLHWVLPIAVLFIRPFGIIVQVVRGSASLGWQDMQTLMRVMMESAEERFRLATAHFSPDEYFVDLLCATARRGVRVEILLPGPHTDKRVCRLAGQHHYDELTACGVRIHQYRPTMMHAKVVTVDGVAALIGSTNFNRRSLDHDEEIMLAVLDEEFTRTLDAHFEADLASSDPIRPGRWKRRSLLQRAQEAAVQPIRRFL